MSGVGKGVATSSIAKILQARGLKVSAIKIDPYLNVDAGTMNPIEHGEVFVLDSGLECDQDMGNYERFLNVSLPSENYMTSGMVYQSVIERERSLGYGGKCVEAVPHIPQEILRRIDRSIKTTQANITIIEIGGTVGEYQNILFIEAARILKLKHPDDVLFVMVSYLPVPSKIGEMKTKPTQYAIRTLNSYGVHPDIIIARSEHPLDRKRKEKIAVSSNIDPENIISAPDIESIYEVPLNFEKEGLSNRLLKLLKLRARATDLASWRRMVGRFQRARRVVKIGMVGKYFKTGDFVLSDVYISVIEALKHAATGLGRQLELTWLDATDFERARSLESLRQFDGIVVPGGFGDRGVEGKINTINFTRRNKIPYFGLCYGMQLAVVEYARNVLGLKKADTTEINPATPYPVIDVMPDQIKKIESKSYGGTMRLGSYPAHLKKGTIARQAYKAELIHERHRHRYEVNPNFVDKLSRAGLIFSGVSPDGKLMEIMELPRKKHPFFLGTQFHPELKSRPLTPHPLFVEFLKAATKRPGSRP